MKSIPLLASYILYFINVHASTVCSVGSFIRLSPSYNLAFENGISLLKKNNDTYLTFNYTSGSKNALDTYQSMDKKGCDIIIGFNNSDELTSISMNNPTRLIVSPYGHNFKAHKNVISLTPPPRYYKKNLPFLLHSIKAKKLKNIYVLYASNRTYASRLYKAYSESLFLQKLSDRIKVISFNEHIIAKYPKLLNAKLLKIKNNSLIFVLAGLTSSSHIIKFISDAKKNIKFIATQNLGSKHFPAFTNILDKIRHPIYIPRHMTSQNTSKEFLNFQKKYFERFKKKPLLISHIASDAIIVASKMQNKTLTLKKAFSSGIKLERRNISFTQYHIIEIKEGEYNLFKTK